LEAHEYHTLFEFETSYWWFRGLHLILLDTLDALGIGHHDAVLDAGCGTGQHLVNVTERITPRAFGFDLASDAAPFWAARGLERVCLASVNDIPFPADTFQAVTSVDVLECDAVNEHRAYHEMWRVLRPGGYLILIVPAYEWLMTEEHHRAVGALRRYSRSRLKGLLNTRPVDIVRMTHVFGSLLPAIAAYRLGLPYLRRRSEGPPKSELRPINPALNRLLFGILRGERRFLQRWDLPFGSSIMAVARKAG
jgi:SAM-dependent methyltransferase